MSSIDDERVRRFYSDCLVPAAERIRNRGIAFFALGPDATEGSWYEPGPAAEPEFVEIEVETCGQHLGELWASAGLPELAALADPLVELAFELELDEEQSAELSPFVYVMY